MRKSAAEIIEIALSGVAGDKDRTPLRSGLELSEDGCARGIAAALAEGRRHRAPVCGQDQWLRLLGAGQVTSAWAIY